MDFNAIFDFEVAAIVFKRFDWISVDLTWICRHSLWIADDRDWETDWRFAFDGGEGVGVFGGFDRFITLPGSLLNAFWTLSERFLGAF